MMNKKGFTLIELIAVIVILALIALIVFPSINSVIKDSKEKAYNEQIATIIKATKQLSYEHSNILPAEIDNSEVSVKLDCLITGCEINGKQIKGGYINDDDIKDPRNTNKNLNGFVKITYNKNQYHYEYKENSAASTKNTVGQTLLKKVSNKAVLKANDNIYKGTSAGNYINFSGSTWRILKINGDNTITIVKNTPAIKLAYDNSGVVAFDKSSINTYLNNTYYNSLSQKNYIKPVIQCIGPWEKACSQTYTANVGLLSTEEYINASNDQNCSITNHSVCANGNFLAISETEYTMNHNGNGVVAINNGLLTTVNPNTVLSIRPVVTLKDSVKITGGEGSSTNPYLIG